MVRAKLFNRNLNRLSTQFEERNNNSPNFINVTFVQDTYTAGKNIFKIKPNYKNIEKNSIDYEILDINGNTIYHKKLEYIDDDGSSVIAIYIYEDTPIGVASIIFVGKATVGLQGESLSPFQNRQNNYRYVHTLHVDKSKRNDSDIIFVNKPLFSVSEKKAYIVEEKFANGKLNTLTGTGSYLLINDSPTILEGGGLFSSDMENGVLSFPVLSDSYFPKQNYSITNFAYSSNIKNIVSPIQLVLETPLTVSSSVGKDSTIIKPVTKIDKQPYSIQYYKSATERNTTQNSKPYAKIDIQNMEADAGHVSRVKVFSKSSVKPSTEYQLVYDSEIHPKNILIDDTTSLIEYPIGIFDGNTNVVSGPSFFSSSLNALNYWNVVRLNGAPPASKVTSSIYLSNSVSVSPTLVMSGSQELMLEQTGSTRTQFWKDTAYKLKFDYYLDKNTLDTRDSKLDVYISGSSFGNNNKFGFYLGSVPTHKGSLSIVRGYTIPILPNFDGDGVLRFVMRDGSKIANIHIEENIESGFSANRTKLYVPIKNEHRLEYLDFKIQFFNYTLKEANKEFEVKDAFFIGGNQYIVGDDNIITGSTFVAPYSSSGIELYGNIAGAKSGSYISSYGYKGIEWSKLYPLTASNYGWSMTQGNPYFSSSYSNATVQMINKSGSLFEFRSNPDSFNMSIVGNNSSVLIGNSGSANNSFVKWNGTDLVIYMSGSALTPLSSSYSATASYVNTLNQNVNIVPPSTGTNEAIYISGSNTVGGSSYIDFIKVSNSTSPVTDPNKTFRLNGEGDVEVIDSSYSNVIWSVTDKGIMKIPSAASKVSQLIATGSAITFNTSGGHLFDDGNFHIHSLNPNANLWLNASGSGLFVINGQTGATGGVCIGTGTQSGYVTISGSVNATYSYGYLANLNPSSPTGYSSGTNPYSLTANQRIQAIEFDATSDERLKNIIGNIELADAIRLVTVVEPIKFTWKDEIDKGIKTGYSAQRLIKTGFEHMVGAVPRVGLEETVDNDGFISPKDSQLVVNTDQITAYHSLLIKHLLERIEELEKKLLVSNN